MGLPGNEASELVASELVAKWQKSFINHLYWCVVSTTDGNGDTIKAKWLSG